MMWHMKGERYIYMPICGECALYIRNQLTLRASPLCVEVSGGKLYVIYSIQ